MRRASRRDANHYAVVAELTQAGFSVQDLSLVGGGCPDLIVAKHGVERWVELKDPERTRKRPHGGSADGRSASQVEWAQSWRGSPVIVAETTEDVLRAFDALMVLQDRYPDPNDWAVKCASR
jgi:hypothetical protein